MIQLSKKIKLAYRVSLNWIKMEVNINVINKGLN